MKLFPLLFVAVILMGGSVFFGALQADATIETRELKQAACNVSPNKEGKYDATGCNTAFDALPAGVFKCAADETVKRGTCTVNADACTNSNGQSGMWCTCAYTCAKKMAAALD